MENKRQSLRHRQVSIKNVFIRLVILENVKLETAITSTSCQSRCVLSHFLNNFFLIILFAQLENE